MVRDARLMVSDPRGYRSRGYYFQLRNTLSQTHWLTNDISTFENALDPLVAEQTKQGKKEHYRQIGDSYIDLWKKRDASYFKIPSTDLEVAGLKIRISAEVGMSFGGDDLALKLWLNSPRPTRSYRQAIQYLTEEGSGGWHQNWQTALWDVRRLETLPRVSIPKDFALALEGQAMAFQQIWKSLGDGDSVGE